MLSSNVSLALIMFDFVLNDYAFSGICGSRCCVLDSSVGSVLIGFGFVSDDDFQHPVSRGIPPHKDRANHRIRRQRDSCSQCVVADNINPLCLNIFLY